MKRLLLSVSFAALVAVVSLSAAAFGSEFGLWLLLWPLTVFHKLLPPARGEFFSIAAVILSSLTSAALYALLTYLALGWRARRRLP